MVLADSCFNLTHESFEKDFDQVLSNAKANKETATKTIRKMNEKEGIVSTTEGEGGMDIAEGDTGIAESTVDGANDTNSATSVNETTAKSGSTSAADLDAHSSDSSEAWVTGTTVITPFGNGVVLEYRPEDGIYAVGLKYGTVYCKGYTIIGAEELSGNALDAIGVQDGSNTNIPANIQHHNSIIIEMCFVFKHAIWL